MVYNTFGGMSFMVSGGIKIGLKKDTGADHTKRGITQTQLMVIV
jgi:hypothetical protein